MFAAAVRQVSENRLRTYAWRCVVPVAVAAVVALDVLYCSVCWIWWVCGGCAVLCVVFCVIFCCVDVTNSRNTL